MHRAHEADTFPTLGIAARKRLGRYDTPRPIAQAMTDWAIRSASDKVLEPSVGGGVFLRSAIARLTSLGSRKPRKQVYVCDIDPAPCMDAEGEGLPAPQVHNRDFLEFDCPVKFTAIIGNPPYVSLRLTTEGARTNYFSQSFKEGFREKKGSIWAHFVIKGSTCLAPGGRLAFLLPEAVLYTGYGRGLLDWATQRFARCSLLSIRERCFISEGTKERVVIVLFDGWGEGPAEGVAITEFSSSQEAISFLSDIDPQAPPSGEWINGHVIPQAISARAHDVYAALENCRGMTTLGGLAKINIGVVTGANDFFLLTEEERRERGLKVSSLLPCLTKFSYCQSHFRYCCSDQDRARENGSRIWLFCPPDQEIDQAALDYIATFPAELVPSNKTFAKRSCWFRPVLTPIPDGFLRYMGADGPKLALNEARATSTNTIHQILFRKKLTIYHRRAIALSIQSTISKLSAEFVGRTYGSGVLKLEPSDCGKLLIPLPRMDAGDITQLWQTCCKLSEEGNHSKATELIDGWIYENWQEEPLPDLDTLQALLGEARSRREG